MTAPYTETDQLILERWRDVMSLFEAHGDVQSKMEDIIRVTGERLGRWAAPLGFEIEIDVKKAEYRAWRSSWSDRRKGSRVYLAMGALCPVGYRKVEDSHPYLWVYTDSLEQFRIKEPERVAFAQALRAALGDKAREWDADGVTDADAPLGRYITDVDDAARARMLLEPEALFEFCTRHLPTVFGLADVIEAELAKLLK